MNDLMLTAIKGYWLANRCSPTVRELMLLCGLSSVSVVLKHLRELEAEGRLLPRTRHQKRAIIPSNMIVTFWENWEVGRITSTVESTIEKQYYPR